MFSSLIGVSKWLINTVQCCQIITTDFLHSIEKLNTFLDSELGFQVLSEKDRN